MHSDWFGLIAPELVVLNTHPHWQLKPKSVINCYYYQTGLYMDLLNQFQHKSFHLCVITATKPFWWQTEDRRLHPLHTYCLDYKLTWKLTPTMNPAVLWCKNCLFWGCHKLCCWITVSICNCWVFRFTRRRERRNLAFQTPKQQNMQMHVVLHCHTLPKLGA